MPPRFDSHVAKHLGGESRLVRGTGNHGANRAIAIKRDLDNPDLILFGPGGGANRSNWRFDEWPKETRPNRSSLGDDE